MGTPKGELGSGEHTVNAEEIVKDIRGNRLENRMVFEMVSKRIKNGSDKSVHGGLKLGDTVFVDVKGKGKRCGRIKKIKTKNSRCFSVEYRSDNKSKTAWFPE